MTLGTRDQAVDRLSPRVAVSAVSRTDDIFKSITLPDYGKELRALGGISTETEKILHR